MKLSEKQLVEWMGNLSEAEKNEIARDAIACTDSLLRSYRRGIKAGQLSIVGEIVLGAGAIYLYKRYEKKKTQTNIPKNEESPG